MAPFSEEPPKELELRAHWDFRECESLPGDYRVLYGCTVDNLREYVSSVGMHLPPAPGSSGRHHPGAELKEGHDYFPPCHPEQQDGIRVIQGEGHERGVGGPRGQEFDGR